MVKPLKASTAMRAVLMAVIAMAVAACASIGRPEGGPKDETPPKYVRSNPAPGTKNFKGNRIEVYFDENIKIEDPVNKVVVSPAQQQQPQIIANGKKLTVLLRDSLLPDQTYTLDFSDAIRDLNEGNILDGFVIDFATGDSIDSLRIAGMVLQASNLEPAQGMIVGAYRNFADSAISTIRVERICKTNQLGQFTLRNLKDEYYRLFAINDVNRDFHWDRSEDVAFYNVPVRPWAQPITVTDTLRSSSGTDSIVTRPGIRYFPNDILLTWFNENYVPLYMTDHRRDKPNIIDLQFSTQVDSLPILKVVNGPNEGKIISDFAVINRSINNDTLQYWLTDSNLIRQDSLLIETRYLKTDSAGVISWTTDTIRYFYRMSRAQEKELEKQQKELEKKEERRLEAIKKWNETGDSIYLKDTIREPEKIEYLDLKSVGGSSQDYNRPLRFTVSEPIRSLDTKGIHLEQMVDSVWKALDDVEFLQDTTGRILEYFVAHPWEYDTKYRFMVDSAAATGIYDKWNKAYTHEFTVKSQDDYSTIVFEIPNKPYKATPHYDWDSLRYALDHPDLVTPVDSTNFGNKTDDGAPVVMDPSEIINENQKIEVDEQITDSVIISGDSIRVMSTEPKIMVELLASGETVVASTELKNGKARFDFITPGTYYARAYIDFNGNGKWDTGSIGEWTQPEDVYYYPKKITLKQNWDMSQHWDLFEIPLDMQKPLEIKKNKPKTKEGNNTPTEDEDEDEDGFGTNYFYNNDSYGNGSRYNNAQRSFGSGFQRNTDQRSNYR